MAFSERHDLEEQPRLIVRLGRGLLDLGNEQVILRGDELVELLVEQVSRARHQAASSRSFSF